MKQVLVGCLPGTIAVANLGLLMLGTIPGTSLQAEPAVTNAVVPAATVTNAAPVALPDIVVRGRSDNMVGIADSATQGTVGAEQLADRPILRPGELLETVPGLIVSQHSGSGKANQYYLRGFNLDHGTDFATSVDGVPVNMPTHAHGQGYTDINFLIPEVVERIDYRKGPYFADVGDFGSAGAANLSYFSSLPQSRLTLEGGTDGYGRALFLSSPKVGEGTLLYGLELFHNDGPWEQAEDYRKFNGVMRYSRGDGDNGFSVTGMAYHGQWESTDQIPLRAVNAGSIGRFGAVDPTDGGNSQRYGLNAEWHGTGDNSFSKLMVYGVYYDLDLFSNFTYFLDDPVNGDQFHQHDRRVMTGVQASHRVDSMFLGREMQNTFGFQNRNDFINNGLSHTANRGYLSTTRADRVSETSLSPWWENRVEWTDWFRTVSGLRGDLYAFNVRSDLPANSGSNTDFIASPKLGLIFGPWEKTEFYINGGLGFHSNDGRGTTTTIDPATSTAVPPVNALVRTFGAEVGVRTAIVPELQSSLSLWWLDIDSELVFVGDAGTTSPSRPSRRYGIEFANFYTPTRWLTLDADLSLSQARFRDEDPAGDRIPGSVQSVVSAGISVHDLGGFFGELRLRYFGPRPLIEDNSIRSSASPLLNARIGYEFNDRWTVAVEVFNLLDQKVSDIDYFYTSRLPGEPAGGISDVHFHPAESRSLRVSMTLRF